MYLCYNDFDCMLPLLVNKIDDKYLDFRLFIIYYNSNNNKNIQIRLFYCNQQRKQFHDFVIPLSEHPVSLHEDC